MLWKVENVHILGNRKIHPFQHLKFSFFLLKFSEFYYGLTFIQKISCPQTSFLLRNSQYIALVWIWQYMYSKNFLILKKTVVSKFFWIFHVYLRNTLISIVTFKREFVDKCLNLSNLVQTVIFIDSFTSHKIPKRQKALILVSHRIWKF